MPDLEQKIEEKAETPAKRPAQELQPEDKVFELEKAEGILEQKAEPEQLPTETKPATAKPSVQTALPAKVQDQVKDLKKLDRQNQVKTLSDLALTKGVDYAIKVAKELDNAYALDEFHDTLVDQLYKQLTEQGKLKKL